VQGALLLALVACSGPGGDDTADLGDLVGILVTPEAVVVPVGSDAQLTAKGLYDDRTSRDITAVVTWTSDNSGVASVSEGLDSEGVLSGTSVGEATVTASVDGIDSVPARITVTDAALLGLTVEPGELTVEQGSEVQLQAMAAWSDGSRGDAAGQVRWITGDGSVAQLGAGGVLVAAGTGTTTIHAEWNDVASADVPVEVLQSASPDLRISGVEGVAGTDDVTLTVTLTNDGTAGAAWYWVDVFLDPSGTPGPEDYGDAYGLVEYTGPGDSITGSFTLPASAGSHQIAAYVDLVGEVEESDESNNSWSGSITVDDASNDGPNIAITYFDWIADETSIYYAVDVTNTGAESVAEFYVDLYIDQTSEPTVPSDGDEFVTVTSLDAGETLFADFLVETWCAYCWSWILADSYDEVAETDETDNVAGPVEVESP